VLHLEGRKGTFINVGGRKVNPERVQRILGGHPDVSEAHVFALDGPSGEQDVHAAVVAPGAEPGELLGYCRDRLARYEVPRLHVVPRLPRSSLGKVDLPRLLGSLTGVRPPAHLRTSPSPSEP
jgi:acyl-CoA synthetase (AMP-forming)/AMP-acid ligase II